MLEGLEFGEFRCLLNVTAGLSTIQHSAFEGPNIGDIGRLLNIQLDEALEGPDIGDTGSLSACS